MNTPSDELKPCPFCCGSAAVNFTDLDERYSYGRSAWVQCGTCGASTARFYHDDPERGSYAIRETANPKAIAAWNTRPAQEIERLREALTRCRDKFLHYEDLHRLKCTSEGDEKADRNREMADMCDAALTPSIKRPE